MIITIALAFGRLDTFFCVIERVLNPPLVQMYKIKRMTTGKHNKYLAYNLSNILELFIIILAVPIKLNLVLVLAH